MPSLSDLPVEILCLIIPFLDPISLISLSQTSLSFRAVISPTRHHFIERLLALELLPEYGGIVPTYRSRDNKLDPPWDSDEWKRNLYACSGCLKLLPHMRFSNHSILGLRLRKPPPQSWEADKLTDWEPLVLKDPSARWIRARDRAARDRVWQEEAKVRYHEAIAGLLALPQNHQNLLRVDMGPIDCQAEEAEKKLCGTERHKRMCHQCRLQRGAWGRPTRDYGISSAPIVRSRQLRFPDALERYFPGLFELPPVEQLPRLFKVWRTERTNLHALYVAFCVGCETWQEFASFCQYSNNPHRNPSNPMTWGGKPPPWPVRCCYCNIRRLGREKFAEELADSVGSLANEILIEIHYRLVFGWRLLERDFFELSGRLSVYKAVGHEILDGLFPDGANSSGRDRVDLIELHGLLDLRRRFQRFQAWMEEAPRAVKESVMQSWFGMWYADYHLNEAAYVRIQNIIQRVKTDPGFLVDYVVERAPYRF